MRLVSLIAVVGVLAPAARATATEVTPDERRRWDASASFYGYAVPDQPDFLMAVAFADIGWLHLEGRYDYEALRTGSAWVGATGGVGQKLKLRATGMVGGVFGELDGVAPGARVTATWWKLDLFCELEYVIDLHEPTESFFYSWSELGLSPLGWLRLGIVGQRSRLFENDLEVQRGLFAGVSFGPIDLTLYELNAGWIAPTFVGALNVSY